MAKLVAGLLIEGSLYPSSHTCCRSRGPRLALSRGFGDPSPVDDSAMTLRESVAALKHDLAKYVAWSSANLEEGHWISPASDELMQALSRDLLSTRTTRDGRAESAWEVWKRFEPQFSECDYQELSLVAEAVGQLEAVEPALRAGDRGLVGERCHEVRAAQMSIRKHVRDLQRRLAQES